MGRWARSPETGGACRGDERAQGEACISIRCFRYFRYTGHVGLLTAQILAIAMLKRLLERFFPIFP
jgi:hypothetical protein